MVCLFELLCESFPLYIEFPDTWGTLIFRIPVLLSHPKKEKDLSTQCKPTSFPLHTEPSSNWYGPGHYLEWEYWNVCLHISWVYKPQSVSRTLQERMEQPVLLDQPTFRIFFHNLEILLIFLLHVLFLHLSNWGQRLTLLLYKSNLQQ